MTTMDSLDADPFAVPGTSARIDYLFNVRRATHRFLVRRAAELWATEQRRSGWGIMIPPHIAALPARQQPQALAADEAARFKRAHLYGLDEEVTAAAVALGADMVDRAETESGVGRVWTPVATPPTPTALLLWASGVGYSSSGVPLIACHWGPLPKGRTWLAWWPDNRAGVRNDIAQLGVTRDQAQTVLREFGPLGYPEVTMALSPRADTTREKDPVFDTAAALLALVSTVLASWALLTTTPGAARLVTRRPTASQTASDRLAGLQPRSATLATGPIDTKTIEGLSRR